MCIGRSTINPVTKDYLKLLSIFEITLFLHIIYVIMKLISIDNQAENVDIKKISIHLNT